MFAASPTHPTNRAVEQVVSRIKHDPGIRYKDWVIAQFMHETGNGTSSLFRNHHNVFGFKYSSKADYRVGRWAGYRSTSRAIAHFRKRQQEFIQENHLNTQASYLQWLSKHYAPNQGYQQKLRKQRKGLKAGKAEPKKPRKHVKTRKHEKPRKQIKSRKHDRPRKNVTSRKPKRRRRR